MSKHLGYVFINLLNIDVIKHIFYFVKIKHNKTCRICNKKLHITTQSSKIITIHGIIAQKHVIILHKSLSF